MSDLDQLKVIFSAEIILLSCGYIYFAANEIWSINWLQQVFNIDLPIFSALLLNAYWPLQLYIYYLERQKSPTPRVITPEMYKGYMILGGLAGIVSLTRCYGIVNLPPTLYVISANSEMVWEALMTKFILKRDLNSWHRIAVMMVVFAIALSLYDPRTGKYGETNDTSAYQLTVGLSLSGLSRFLSSLNTILAERLLGKDRKSVLGVAECSFFNSFIPCMTIPLIFIVVPEYKEWGILTKPRSGAQLSLLLFLCLGLAISKLIDRLCKFSIVNKASTMYFAGVNAAMMVVAGVGSIAFFRGSDNTSTNWAHVVSFVIIILAFIPMRIGSFHEKEEENRKKHNKYLEEHPKAPRNLGDGKTYATDSQGVAAVRQSITQGQNGPSISALLHHPDEDEHRTTFSMLTSVADFFGDLDIYTPSDFRDSQSEVSNDPRFSSIIKAEAGGTEPNAVELTAFSMSNIGSSYEKARNTRLQLLGTVREGEDERMSERETEKSSSISTLAFTKQQNTNPLHKLNNA